MRSRPSLVVIVDKLRQQRCQHNEIIPWQVENGTMACNYLTVGDRILEIDGMDCYSLTQSQAASFLRRPSESIELLILKRRGETVVQPPKRSSSCKAFQNFALPTPSPQQPCTTEPNCSDRRQSGDRGTVEPTPPLEFFDAGTGQQPAGRPDGIAGKRVRWTGTYTSHVAFKSK